MIEFAAYLALMIAYCIMGVCAIIIFPILTIGFTIEILKFAKEDLKDWIRKNKGSMRCFRN